MSTAKTSPEWLTLLQAPALYGDYITTADDCRAMVRNFSSPVPVQSTVDLPACLPDTTKLLGEVTALRYAEETAELQGLVTWKPWLYMRPRLTIAYLRDARSRETGEATGAMLLYAFPASAEPAERA